VADQPPFNRKSRFETIDAGEKWGTLTAIDLAAKGQDPVVRIVNSLAQGK
jgi:hypothetical protein